MLQKPSSSMESLDSRQSEDEDSDFEEAAEKEGLEFLNEQDLQSAVGEKQSASVQFSVPNPDYKPGLWKTKFVSEFFLQRFARFTEPAKSQKKARRSKRKLVSTKKSETTRERLKKKCRTK